jgi:hypothetical protein
MKLIMQEYGSKKIDSNRTTVAIKKFLEGMEVGTKKLLVSCVLDPPNPHLPSYIHVSHDMIN